MRVTETIENMIILTRTPTKQSAPATRQPTRAAYLNRIADTALRSRKPLAKYAASKNT